MHDKLFVICYHNIMFTHIIDGVRQLLFPDNCLLCRTFLNSNHQQQLCPTCKAGITCNTAPFCTRCSRHLEHFNEDSLCEICQGEHLDIDRMWGCCLYQEPLSQLIYAFKYNGKTALHRTFTQLMQEFITSYHIPINDFDLIAPIPLHPVKLRERGYNQAELLSAPLSQHWNVRHEPSLLLRIMATPTQTMLSQKQRWTNTQGAFKMNPSISVTDKSILLVDDILTTKATANAAATALKQADAAYVGIITLAIT